MNKNNQTTSTKFDFVFYQARKNMTLRFNSEYASANSKKVLSLGYHREVILRVFVSGFISEIIIQFLID